MLTSRGGTSGIVMCSAPTAPGARRGWTDGRRVRASKRQGRVGETRTSQSLWNKATLALS